MSDTTTLPKPNPPAPPAAPAIASRSERLVPILLLAFAGLAIWNAARRDFWGRETVHAVIVHEIAAAPTQLESWLVPRLGGEPYLALAPLSYWLGAVSALIPGLDPHLAYRIPGVLSAVLALCSTLWIGRRLFDPSIAFLAFVMQGSTLLFFFDAAWLGSDLPFVCLFQLALGNFFLAMREKAPRRHVWVAWIALAGAGLTKSPLLALGLALPVLATHRILGHWLRNSRQVIRRVAPLPAVLAFVAIAGSWYAYLWAASDLGPTLIAEHWRSGHLDVFRSDHAGARAPYFYLLAIFVAFLPWSLFLVLGVLHAKDRTRREGERAMLTWFVVTLVALSFVAYKQASFLLLVLPPACLMVAAAFAETGERFSVWEDYLRDHLFRFVPWVLKAPAILALVLASASLARFHERLDIPWLSSLFADDANRHAILLLLAIAGVTAWITAQRLRREIESPARQRRILELARASIFLLFVGSFLAPALDPVQSSRTFLREVDATVGSAHLATYGAERPAAFFFYLPDREVIHFEELIVSSDREDPKQERRTRLEHYLASEEPVWLLAPAGEFEGLRTQFPGTASNVREVRRGRMGVHGDYVLLANRAR